VCGALDFDDVNQRCRELAAAAPRARFELLPGVAHLPQLEDPDAVLRGIAGDIGA
jgi:pimeloyl-ACP methyl ester carboxylesterase